MILYFYRENAFKRFRWRCAAGNDKKLAVGSAIIPQPKQPFAPEPHESITSEPKQPISPEPEEAEPLEFTTSTPKPPTSGPQPAEETVNHDSAGHIHEPFLEFDLDLSAITGSSNKYTPSMHLLTSQIPRLQK